MDLESITAGVTVTSGVLSTALICGIGYLLYSFLSGIWFWVAVVGIIIYKLTFSRIIRMFRRR